MRLIDAEELKKALAKNITIWNFNVSYDGILAEIIDNAPTVEPTFKPIAEVKFDKEQLQEIVDKAKAEILESVERPQGKWVDPQNVGANNWCSVCGEFILHYDGICNYCPNCGAEMEKGGEEE